jgi:hypothetical protein
VAVADVKSVTWMVNVNDPAAVGVPLNVLPESAMPGGSVPAVFA